MRRSPRPSPAQYARAWACPVPLGPNSATLHTAPPGAQSRQRLRACRWCLPPRLGLVARRRAVRGPPPFATLYNGPQAARRWRGLPGARGAARSRPRVALVCAALGPPRRNARRGCPNPPRYAKKMPHGGSSGPPRPLGPRVPLAPWRLFRPRAYPPPSPPASVAGGGRGRFWLPSPGGGARSRGSRGREGFARSRPSRALWRLCPLVFFLPPPAPSCGPRAFPFAPAAGGCRSCSLHGGPPWAGRAALAGGPVYRRC